MAMVGRVITVHLRGYAVYCVGNVHGLLPLTAVPEKLQQDDYLSVSVNHAKCTFGRRILKYEGRSTKEVFEQSVQRLMGEVDLERIVKRNSKTRASSV